jgi:hypothetical protein
MFANSFCLRRTSRSNGRARTAAVPVRLWMLRGRPEITPARERFPDDF